LQVPATPTTPTAQHTDKKQPHRHAATTGVSDIMPSTSHTRPSTGHTRPSTGHTRPSTGHTRPSTTRNAVSEGGVPTSPRQTPRLLGPRNIDLQALADEDDVPQSPQETPPEDFVLISTYGSTELGVTWDVCEVKCWVCGQATLADAKAVVPLIVGGISVQSRSMSMNRYARVCACRMYRFVCGCVCTCRCVQSRHAKQ
jgi:hypothetical protein